MDRRAFLKSAGLTAAVLAEPWRSDAAPAETKYDFDTPYTRVGTDSTKWDQPLRNFGEKALVAGMGIADMDFKAPPCITKALMDRVQHENWGYLDMPGFTASMSKAIIDWNKKRYGVEINKDLLVLTTGVHPGLIAAIATFTRPGGKVLLTTPTYNGFYSDLTFTQTRPEESPMKVVNGRYQIDFEDFERRISHDTNTFILCNPQNPTGNCWSPEDLTRIGEICLRRRVVVLADEIHCDFVNKGQKYTPFSTLPNKDIVRNSITFKAASKSFGLAAMKCAWYFSDNAEYIARVKANTRADLTTLGLLASRAAYTPEGEEWLNQCVAYIDGNHDFVDAYVRANIPSISCVKPQGTYLSWLDVSAVAARIDAKSHAAAEVGKLTPSGRAVTAETIVERHLVKHAKVHLNAGSSYGPGGENHMRMNIATSRRTLEAALTSMAKALKNT